MILNHASTIFYFEQVDPTAISIYNALSQWTPDACGATREVFRYTPWSILRRPGLKTIIQYKEVSLPNIRRILIAVLVFPLLIWTVDSATSIIQYHNQNFLDQWLYPNSEEARARLLLTFFITLIIFIFGFIWNRYYSPFSEPFKSSDPFGNLVSISPDCIIVHRHNKILFANQNTLEFFRVNNFQQFRDASILDFIHPNYIELVAERQQQILTSGMPSELIEVRLLLLDGSVRSVSLYSAIIDYESEPALLTFFRDMTEATITRKELIDSRERLQLALEAAQDGVWDWDIPSGKMVYSNTWAKMLGFELEELKTDESTWLYLIHPQDHARSSTLLKAHLRGDLPQYESEVRLRHKNGHYLWVLDRGRVVSRDDLGKPLRMTGTHRDITARKEAELALEIRNRIAEIFLIEEDLGKYHLLLETIVQGSECGSGLFATLDDNKSLRVWSVYPAQDISTDITTSLRIPAEEVPLFLKPVLENQKSIILEHAQLVGPVDIGFKAALAVPITNREKVIGVIMLGDKFQGFFDSDRSLVESLAGYMAPILQSHLTSEIRELQLRQAQKMEALGALAGGIAHDFNNILQAIMGFTTLARDEAPEESLIAKDLQKVLKASRRGQDLVQRILLFSRREEQEYKTVSIYELAAEAVELIAPSIPSTIEVKSVLDKKCGLIWADPSQINQIIMNLATNAFHAMEKNGGVMEIGLRLLVEGEYGLDLPDFLQNREVIMLWVSDNGCGIKPNELDRVFDPFYTTKEVGRGTGLGLSVVHGIITNHGGSIQLESTPNQGTTARVFLPSRIQEILPPKTQCDLPFLSTQDLHILFIDDDEDITAIGQAILQKSGFQVTAMSDSPLALSSIQANPAKYDLVITDLTMPHLTGLELAKAVGLVRPDLPVILITGLGDDKSNRWDQQPNISGLVHKPFDMSTLCNTIITVLSTPPNEAL